MHAKIRTNIGKNVSYINRILNNKIMPSIEVLGHHRPDITNTYLAEKPVRKRKQ